MLLLATSFALAQEGPPPGSITLNGRGVMIDGKRASLNRAKPWLIQDAGSRKRARSAKAMSTVGTITGIAGAAMVVIGGITISDGDLSVNGPSYGLTGMGFVVLGTGIGFKLGSNTKWRRSVGDYQGR